MRRKKQKGGKEDRFFRPAPRRVRLRLRGSGDLSNIKGRAAPAMETNGHPIQMEAWSLLQPPAVWSFVSHSSAEKGSFNCPNTPDGSSSSSRYRTGPRP